MLCLYFLPQEGKKVKHCVLYCAYSCTKLQIWAIDYFALTEASLPPCLILATESDWYFIFCQHSSIMHTPCWHLSEYDLVHESDCASLTHLFTHSSVESSSWASLMTSDTSVIGFGPICWIRLIWLASHYCIIGPGSQPADAVPVPEPEYKRTKEYLSSSRWQSEVQAHHGSYGILGFEGELNSCAQM